MLFTHSSHCNSRQCSRVIHDLDESIEFAICAQQEIEFIQIKDCSKDCLQIRLKSKKIHKYNLVNMN
jgi:hypothetical protein